MDTIMMKKGGICLNKKEIAILKEAVNVFDSMLDFVSENRLDNVIVNGAESNYDELIDCWDSVNSFLEKIT